jgi:hypothetical protein
VSTIEGAVIGVIVGFDVGVVGVNADATVVGFGRGVTGSRLGAVSWFFVTGAGDAGQAASDSRPSKQALQKNRVNMLSLLFLRCCFDFALQLLGLCLELAELLYCGLALCFLGLAL